ncbi:hypothetical protein C1H46_031930 [Malus baccata]|uniref:DUF4408 domain-containing protein n=1 Tax=Malus baccata TaxID=106549 RepID=A0A540L7Q3_MALBA|nr:hypothetical protein C1H46_031930 [Malus baccata]
MAKLQQNLVQDLAKPYKSREYYPHKAKGISILAFFFSILIYICIFYIFNISLSTVFNNSKFWFAISNTLILIIAVDCGAFSSASKDQQDHFYQEYMMHSQAARSASSFVSQYPQIVNKSSPKQLEAGNNRKTKNEEVLLVPQNTEIVQEKRVVKMLKGDNDQNKSCSTGRENVREKTYRRSKSEKAKRGVINNERKNTLRRSETTYQKHKPTADEDNEFSTMSNEELNKRAEEFIQRFNRQIRIQSTATTFP